MDEIPADAYYDVTSVGEVAVSPDGERVAYLATESDPDEDEQVTSLFVVPADGSEDPHRLTRASSASSPTWSPDGSKLGFVAARETDTDLQVGRDEEDEEGEDESEECDEDETADGEGADDEGEDETADGEGADDEEDDEAPSDDEPKPQVWYFDLRRGGDAVQVTDREEGVSGFDWSPGGERVVVSARDPTDEEREEIRQRREDGPIEVERLQHKFDGQGYLDEVTTYLFVVDVESREETRIDDANDGGYGFFGGLQPAWGPGDRIAYVANHTDWPDDNYVRDVYTIDPDGSDRRKLTDSALSAGSLTWGPDGDRLAFSGRDPDNWYVPTEVYVAVDDGASDPEGAAYGSVSADLDRTLAWGGMPEWVDDDRLVGLIADEGRSRVAEFHVDGAGGGPDGGDAPAGHAERAFAVQGDYEGLGGLDVGGDTVAFRTTRPAEGTDVYAIRVDDLGATGEDPRVRLTATNDDLIEAHPMPGCERLTFESEDGETVEAIAYLPADFDPDDPDERGLVLDIHGGPMSYDQPGFRFQDAFFASRGYVVLKVNYRGSTSYGRAFCEALKGAWGTKDVADLQAGVDEAIDRGWADPDRLFPTGFSQGGVNTAYLVTRDDRWRAAAAEHGVYDYRSSFGTDDSQNWWESDFGLPWEEPENYEAHSSITDVGDVETPLLVTAGEEDWRCPPGQAEQLYVSVRKQGVDAKLVIYQGEHHNVGDPDRAIHRLEELDGWFARYDPDREAPEERGEEANGKDGAGDSE